MSYHEDIARAEQISADYNAGRYDADDLRSRANDGQSITPAELLRLAQIDHQLAQRVLDENRITPITEENA